MTGLFDIAGKSALVTGGSRGIGLMIARGFVEAGATVYISSRKAEVCDAVAAELSELGPCVSIPADLSLDDEVHRLAAEVVGRAPRSTSSSTTRAPPGARRSPSTPPTPGTR